MGNASNPKSAKQRIFVKHENKKAATDFTDFTDLEKWFSEIREICGVLVYGQMYIIVK
jgi:hypothetical protein